jgi:microcystin-dependent protein
MLDGEVSDIESLKKAFSNGKTPDELDFLSLIKSCINRQGNGFELVEPLMANEKEAIQGMEAKKLISPFTLARTLASLIYPELKKLQNKDKELEAKDKVLDAKDADLQKQINDVLANSTRALPIGSVILWGLTLDVLPSNFIICDGRTITINGKPYKVPNLVDRFALGIKADGLRNKEDGKATVALEAKHLAAHNHKVSKTGEHQHTTYVLRMKPANTVSFGTADGLDFHVNYVSGGGTFGLQNLKRAIIQPGNGADALITATGYPINQTDWNNLNPPEVGAHTHDTVGNNEAHENMPPYCTVYYVIKIAN